MNAILDEIDRSDALVLASPMNFWTVTAVMKRFIERLICFAYWPWGMHAPKMRNKLKTKRAVVVVSSAAPSLACPADDAHGRPDEELRRPARGEDRRCAFHRPCRRRAEARVERADQEKGPTPGKETGPSDYPSGMIPPRRGKWYLNIACVVMKHPPGGKA